jgi:fucose 4-O-acetylase-like acetyltransferase
VERKTWVDIARGIGIFLVVFAHALRGLFRSGILPETPLLEMIDAFIYTFHMPLFFFLSGLFVQSVYKGTIRKFLRGKVGRLLYPYFLWATLSTLLSWLASSFVNSPVSYRTFLEIPYDPPTQFWFIYTLFFISVIQFFAQRAQIPALAVLFIWTAFYCSSGWLSLPDWGVLYSVRVYGLYFGGGVVCSRVVMGSTLDDIKGPVLALASVAGYAIVLSAVLLDLDTAALYGPLLVLAGVASTLALSMLLSRVAVCGFLENWGLRSLEIYVAHSILSAGFRIIFQKGFHIEQGTFHLILGTAVGILGAVELAKFTEKRNIPYLFALPKS